jgi:hypothetical protein
MSLAARSIRLAAALLMLAAGCEALIDGKLHEVRCQAEGTVGPPACPTGNMCKKGLCVPTELGALCTSDEDCGQGDLCLDPARIGAAGLPRCSRACCSSSDCDPDPQFVCWLAPEGAGSFCRAAGEVGRHAAGTGEPGSACTKPGDCRSGLCNGERCMDTCCSDTGCNAAGGVCDFTAASVSDQPAGFWCSMPPKDRKPRYAVCSAHSDCASGLCIPLAPDGVPRCSEPCCASSQCEMLPDKLIPVACAPVQVGEVWVHACSALVLGSATGAVGTKCNADGDCRSGACDADTGRCTDACCVDASCGDHSYVCRPSGKPTAWALRCKPR